MIVRKSSLLSLCLFCGDPGRGGERGGAGTGPGGGGRMAMMAEAFAVPTTTLSGVGPVPLPLPLSDRRRRLRTEIAAADGINGSHDHDDDGEANGVSPYSVLGTSFSAPLPSFSAPPQAPTATNGDGLIGADDPFPGHDEFHESFQQELLQEEEEHRAYREQQERRAAAAAAAAALSMDVDGNGTGSLMGRSVTNGGKEAPLMVTNLRNAFPVDSGRPKPSELAAIKGGPSATSSGGGGRVLKRYDPSIHRDEVHPAAATHHRAPVSAPRLNRYDLASNPSVLGLATAAVPPGRRQFSSLDNTGVTIDTGSSQNHGQKVLKVYRKEDQGDNNNHNNNNNNNKNRPTLPSARTPPGRSDDHNAAPTGPRLKHYDLATNPSVLGLAETFLRKEQQQNRSSMADSTGVTIGVGLEPNKGKKLTAWFGDNDNDVGDGNDNGDGGGTAKAKATLSKDLYYTKWIDPTDATMARKTGLTVNKPISLWTERDKFLDY